MEYVHRIVQLMGKGDIFCLATIIASDNPDVATGRKMIVLKDGTIEGGVGDAHLDAVVRTMAMEVLSDLKRRTVEIAANILVFLDIFPTDVKLLICGAGHVAMPLTRFARDVGFKITVLDDRSDFAHPSRFPGCEVIANDFASALRDMPLSPTTYVVVITRGHEHDVECLAEILPKNTAYVGLIGSRRRVYFVLDMLSRKGIPRDRLDVVFTPIGIPIGSESPEEIALSIVAELVCVRRKGLSQARALRAAVGGAA